MIYNNYIMHKILYAGRHSTTHSVASHKHKNWEFVYCTDGNGVFYSHDGSIMTYSKNEIVCVPPEFEHSNGSTEGFTNIHIVLDDALLPTTDFIKIIDNPSRILRDCFSQSFYFFNCDTQGKQDILFSLGELIGNCLVSFLDVERYSPAVENIRSLILRNFKDCHFDLTEVLTQASNNSEYARKLFKKETGLTPLQFLTDTRINYAKKLLKADSLFDNINITQTALECGFGDSLYFSRIFKKHTGKCPKDFKRIEE